MNSESCVICATVSPMTRIFDDFIPSEDFTYISGMRNEPLAFSLAYRSTAEKAKNGRSPDTPISVRVTSTLPVSVYKVCKVPYAAAECEDGGEGAKGGCPDILIPRSAAPQICHLPADTGLPYYEKDETVLLNASCFATQSVYIGINEDGKSMSAGDHSVTVEIIGLMTNEVLATRTVRVHLIDRELPESDLIYTNWFHNDALCDITHLPLYSDAYFAVFEKYIKNSVKNGMNTLLFPTFTPPLDTAVGLRRKNVQLVKVYKSGDEYSFDFTLAERYATIAKNAGIKKLEHTHLFSQWGAKSAIAIYAEVGEKEVCLFDYKTPATDKEYIRFLSAYLSAFKCFIKKMGIEKDILYHISDEPVLANIDGYRRAKNLMREIFPDGKFMDALDDYEFYKTGLVEMPIVDLQSIGGYEGKCDNMMLYYTGGEATPGLVNRTLTSAPKRTRALGYVLYNYKAKGFLHWAYNYYYGRLSTGIFHPAQDPCFYKNIPGITYLVYPDTDGSPLPSLREKQMLAAMCDYRALKLLEALIEREEVLALLEEHLGGKIHVTTMARSAEAFLSMREAINERIESAIQK